LVCKDTNLFAKNEREWQKITIEGCVYSVSLAEVAFLGLFLQNLPEVVSSEAIPVNLAEVVFSEAFPVSLAEVASIWSFHGTSFVLVNCPCKRGISNGLFP
jgi:hypothetical protein